jgi:hypothetical protein
VAEYPIVECDKHPPAPGYVTCTCVIDGADVAFMDPATPEHLGQILCIDCHTNPPELPSDKMVLVCSRCAAGRGWIPKG